MEETSGYCLILNRLPPAVRSGPNVSRLTQQLEEVDKGFQWLRDCLKSKNHPRHDAIAREYDRQIADLSTLLRDNALALQSTKTAGKDTTQPQAKQQKLVRQLMRLQDKKAGYIRQGEAKISFHARANKQSKLTQQKTQLMGELSRLAEDYAAEDDYARQTGGISLTTVA